MSCDIAIGVRNLNKCYHIYEKPRDRLLQMIFRKKKFYRDFWALKNISFEVKKGESVGIIGLNGSGKSTLLQLISGTLFPTEGVIETNGRIAALLELGSAFNPEFTGRENIYMNGAVLGLSKDEIDSRYNNIIEFADIGEFIDQELKTYSSGMIVRLAFAVSVCVDPDILIIDEALAVGDAPFQFKCLERLKRLTQSGVTLLLVSHDISIVKNFCNRAIYLKKGELNAQGAAEMISELYIMDIHDQQQKNLKSNGSRVNIKQFVGNRNGIAFGTSQGRITEVKFVDSEQSNTIFFGDENAAVLISFEFKSSLINPVLGVVLQNHRTVEIGGHIFNLVANFPDDDFSTGRIVFNLPMKFGSGHYHLTVKLGSRVGQKEFVWIDKQVGVLTFEVQRPQLKFLGSVDLGIAQILK